MGLIGLAAIGWILKSLCENGIPYSRALFRKGPGGIVADPGRGASPVRSAGLGGRHADAARRSAQARHRAGDRVQADRGTGSGAAPTPLNRRAGPG